MSRPCSERTLKRHLDTFPGGPWDEEQMREFGGL
jgi:hypothetical protein